MINKITSVCLLLILLSGCELKPEDLRVAKRDNKFGFTDKKGRFVIPPIYNYAHRFTEGVALVQLNGKFGFIGSTGKFVIDTKFDDATDFLDGKAWVVLDGQVGTVNKQGDYIAFPYNWTEFPPGPSGYAKITLNEKQGLIDRSGKIITEPRFDDLYFMDFSNSLEEFKNNGLVWGKVNGKWGLIGKSGQWLIEPTFDSVGHSRDFGEQFMIVKVVRERCGFESPFVPPYRSGLVDHDGHILIEPIMENWTPFNIKIPAYYYLVQTGCKWGILEIINKSKRVVLEPRYDFIDGIKLDCPVARIEKDKKWGFVDETGKVIIEPTFDEMDDFKNGVAKVRLGLRTGEIDTKGQLKWNE